MKRLQKTGLAICFALLATPVPADQILQCAFPPKAANGGWMPDQLVLNYDQKKQAVTVFDPIIYHFAKVPVAAKVNADNNSRLSVSWTVKATLSASNQFADMRYRLTVLKANGTASMTGQPVNYSGPYTTQGRCTVASRKTRK